MRKTKFTLDKCFAFTKQNLKINKTFNAKGSFQPNSTEIRNRYSQIFLDF